MAAKELLTGTTTLRLPWRARVQVLLTGEVRFECHHVLDKPLDGPPPPSQVAAYFRWPLQRLKGRATGGDPSPV